jgi:transposase InsO family protein/transposase
MTRPELPATAAKTDRRVQAVLALFQGEAVADVCGQYQIGRSDLYKYRHRALTAIRAALTDQPRGPRQPANHLSPRQEAQIVTLCQQHPTWSARAIQAHGGVDAPSLRTIQRVRARHGLVHASKRPPALSTGYRLTPAERQRVQELLETKPYLGPERAAWDLRNAEGIRLSPSTVKYYQQRRRATLAIQAQPLAPRPVWRRYERQHPHHLWHGDMLAKVTLPALDQTAYQLTLQDDYSRGYVFCELVLHPDLRTTIRALIAAMRQWQVIPQAVVFDNGAPFKGKLLTAFCDQVGIRLIYITVGHPQTNGKLERAFRDDMREFYRQYATWDLERLRHDLPGYVHYRNHVRGYQALRGDPAITRLSAYTPVVVPSVLESLAQYACYEVGRKHLSPTGGFRLLGREAHVGEAWADSDVMLYESLDGLEARCDGQRLVILPDYRTFKQIACCPWDSRLVLPEAFYFEPAVSLGRP